MGWEVATKEHTFSTGRMGLLREHASFFQLAHVMDPETGREAEGVGMGEFTFAVLTSMFVKPKIVAEPEFAMGEDQVWWGDLRDEEILETLELWKAQVGDAERFRAITDGAVGSKNGKSVGKGPKRTRTDQRPAGVAR